MLVFICILASFVASDQPPCATTCHALNCDNTGIRYGKYCGVGHGGCPGEKPCDSVDACCKRHDSCVEEAGIFSANKCHKDFIQCLDKRGNRKDGFSEECPYSTVVPNMRESIRAVMSLTEMFGGAFNQQDEEL